MRRWVVWMIGVTATVIVFGCAGLAIVPIDLAAAITLGWIWYLARTLPEVQVGSAGVATAAVCLVLFVVGSHIFLGWLFQGIRRTSGSSAPQHARWKWRWTSGLATVIVLMFVAGMSVVGVTHQLGWLLTSKEPWVVSDSGAAARAQSTNNLKQIGLALHWYHQEHGSLPPGGTFDRQGRPLQSWQAMILRYIEGDELYERIDFSIPWNDLRNAPVFQTEIPAYLRPGILAQKNADGYALSHYAGSAYMLGGDRPRTFSDVSDGTSNTLLAGEVTAGFKAWGDPTNWRDPALGLNRNLRGFASPSPGGVNFLMVDGSVRFIKNTIDAGVLKGLSTPAGGEKVGIHED